jgi:3-isopropylmalate/(R)-2-methylmalate dehydratase small subunit
MKHGDFIVGGKNFGCGSSREHAPIAIKAAKVAVVIADSFARIFYRNAFNMGLPILESPEASAELTSGQEIKVNLDTGEIVAVDTGKVYKSTPIPPFMQELLEDGGLMAHLRKRLGGQSA